MLLLPCFGLLKLKMLPAKFLPVLLCLQLFIVTTKSHQLSAKKKWLINYILHTPDIDTPKEDTSRPVVTISDGALRGFTMSTVNGRAFSAFQNIPYAQPPVGSLRFKDPVKNSPWNGIRDAASEASECIQLDLIRNREIHGLEDCMYINVYTPQINSTRSLPVMVFIHGGGYIYGAGSIYGPRYLLDRDIVLVTLNFRLGPFGFLSTGDDASPGNQALKDQVLALKWVQSNIAAFGGNANSVTLFGESVGGSCVQYHMVSPMSRGLFHRGISQSGTAMCYSETDNNRYPEGAAAAAQVAEALNCPTNSSVEMVECLRNVPKEELASVQVNFIEFLRFPFIALTRPTVEHDHPGAFMTKTAEQYYEDGEAHNVTWINGLNKDDFEWVVAAFITDTDGMNQINTDWDRVGPMVLAFNNETTELSVERARNVWDYYMGTSNFSFDTRHEFSQMITDRYVTECVLEAMRYHSLYTKQPVYAYDFSHQGRHTGVEMFGQNPEDWGVVHYDDLIYLLNNTVLYPTLNPGDPELEMSDIMTSLWTNFAAEGKPYIVRNGRRRYIWEPIQPSTNLFSPIRFLDLNLNPTMVEDPYIDRYNFWRMILEPNA